MVQRTGTQQIPVSRVASFLNAPLHIHVEREIPDHLHDVLRHVQAQAHLRLLGEELEHARAELLHGEYRVGAIGVPLRNVDVALEDLAIEVLRDLLLPLQHSKTTRILRLWWSVVLILPH